MDYKGLYVILLCPNEWLDLVESKLLLSNGWSNPSLFKVLSIKNMQNLAEIFRWRSWALIPLDFWNYSNSITTSDKYWVKHVFQIKLLTVRNKNLNKHILPCQLSDTSFVKFYFDTTIQWITFFFFFWCTPFGCFFQCNSKQIAYTIQYPVPGFEPTTTQLWVFYLNQMTMAHRQPSHDFPAFFLLV